MIIGPLGGLRAKFLALWKFLVETPAVQYNYEPFGSMHVVIHKSTYECTYTVKPRLSDPCLSDTLEFRQSNRGNKFFTMILTSLIRKFEIRL